LDWIGLGQDFQATLWIGLNWVSKNGPMSNSVASSWKKITTRRREGVGVVVEKKKKVDELSTKIHVIYLQQ